MDIVILVFVIQGAIGLFDIVQGAAFRFRHPMVQGALADILGRPASPCADYSRTATMRPFSKG